MAEFRPRFHTKMLGHCLITNTTQRNHHPKLGEILELTIQERSAVGAFVWSGFVGRRCTFDRRRDPRICEFQTVVFVDALWLIGETGPVQASIQPVAGPVTGEHTSGAVGTVCGRSKPNNHQAGGRVAEARNALAPVVVVSK